MEELLETSDQEQKRATMIAEYQDMLAKLDGIIESAFPFERQQQKAIRKG